MKAQKTFQYVENQAEYVIQFKRKKYYLLLLLLPLLLLLLPVEEVFIFDVFDSQELFSIENANVELVNIGTSEIFTQNTNAEGEAEIHTGRQILLTKLLNETTPQNNTYKIKISKECYQDSIYQEITSVLKKQKQSVPLAAVSKNISVVVVSSSGDKLPQAEVVATITDNSGNNKVITGITDSSGFLVLEKIPICSSFTILAQKNSYSSDSISVTNVTEVISSEQILLTLRPDAPAPPTENCRIFVSGQLAADGTMESEIYNPNDCCSEYVGAGEYPDNTLAFPKAVRTTFDGIAIAEGTRVIIYSGKNFTGNVVLDMVGPAIINNVRFKADYAQVNTMRFKEPLQTLFPQSVRHWSNSDMHSWSYGSMKVLCGY